MGEIADMMLDGTMCATCGEFIHEGDADGFPRYCCDDCDPYYTPDNQKPAPKGDKPFFVVKHAGSINALPKFLESVSFAYMDDSGTDKKGNPLLRLLYDKYPNRDHAWGVETRGIICVVSPYLLDQAKAIVNEYVRKLAVKDADHGQ